jgi:hypothetical protein
MNRLTKHPIENSTNNTGENMNALISVICASVAASSIQAATIPAGTTITVSTVSLITSQDAVGGTFEAKIAQNVSVKGNVLLKTGAKAFGKVSSSRRNPRKSEPLSVELASIEVNGRRVALKTSPVEPHGPPQTARQAQYGHTAGTTVVNPGTRMQFQLLQSVTL